MANMYLSICHPMTGKGYCKYKIYTALHKICDIYNSMGDQYQLPTIKGHDLVSSCPHTTKTVHFGCC